MLAYNECGGARGHWTVRNLLNAIGYALAEAGATLVTCSSLLVFGSTEGCFSMV